MVIYSFNFHQETAETVGHTGCSQDVEILPLKKE